MTATTSDRSTFVSPALRGLVIEPPSKDAPHWWVECDDGKTMSSNGKLTRSDLLTGLIFFGYKPVRIVPPVDEVTGTR